MFQSAEAWVAHQIAFHRPSFDVDPLEYAFELVAIADDYGEPLGVIADWLRYDAPGKDWSPAGFASWCGRLADTRDRLQRRRDELCEQCSLPLMRTRRGWLLCSGCGLAQLR
jgi:hypothetical protein